MGREGSGFPANQLHEFSAVGGNQFTPRWTLPFRVQDFVNFDNQVALLQPVHCRTIHHSFDQIQAPPGQFPHGGLSVGRIHPS